jgi:hypothetical protein
VLSADLGTVLDPEDPRAPRAPETATPCANGAGWEIGEKFWRGQGQGARGGGAGQIIEMRRWRANAPLAPLLPPFSPRLLRRDYAFRMKRCSPIVNVFSGLTTRDCDGGTYDSSAAGGWGSGSSENNFYLRALV